MLSATVARYNWFMTTPQSSSDVAKTFDLLGHPVPLRVDSTGTVRVAQTRVTLDTVIGAFLSGDSAEIIAHSYPTLMLDDVYAVIAYYLRHRMEVDSYLALRRQEAGEIRRQAEAMCPPATLRARLLERAQAKGMSGHAQAGNG